MSILVAGLGELEQLEFGLTAERFLKICKGLLENDDCRKYARLFIVFLGLKL